MEREAFLAGMAAAVERRKQQVATVHERVACPRCRAGVGEVCRNMTRSYRRGRPVKNPHSERLHADGIYER